MRIVFIPQFLLVSLLAGASGSRPPGQETKNSQFDLPVTFKVLSTSYCVGDDGQFIFTTLRVHVRIQNQTKRPVILCQKYVTVWAPRLFHVGADGKRGDVADRTMPDTLGLFDPSYPKNLRSGYAIVQPGAPFELDSDTMLSTWFPRGATKSKGVPPPGSYLLQVTLRTWSGPPTEPSILREKWKSVGDLFTGFLDSDLVPITIDPPEALPPCK